MTESVAIGPRDYQGTQVLPPAPTCSTPTTGVWASWRDT
jgi:hypothetical protein